MIDYIRRGCGKSILLSMVPGGASGGTVIMAREGSGIESFEDLDGAEIQAFGDASFDLKFLKEQPDFAELTDTQFLN